MKTATSTSHVAEVQIAWSNTDGCSPWNYFYWL